MKFIATEIPDVILIEPNAFADSRGFFIETYREDLFREGGISVRFVQDNHSKSDKGVLRGLHYQMAPKTQAKLVRVIRGEILDVAVDIRKKSRTFGKHVAVVLNQTNQKMLYVPEGFAHGFLVLADETEVLYKVNSLYSPQDEAGIFWNDPALGIHWPRLDKPYLLSPKDQRYPLLKDAKVFE